MGDSTGGVAEVFVAGQSLNGIERVQMHFGGGFLYHNCAVFGQQLLGVQL